MEMNDIVYSAHTAVALIAAGPAPGQDPSQQPPFLVTMGPFIILFVLMYFLIIRPHQKRQKEHDRLIGGVKPGDKVIAAGGIYGVVTNVKEQSILMKIADNVKIEVQKSSVITVTKPSSDEVKPEAGPQSNTKT